MAVPSPTGKKSLAPIVKNTISAVPAPPNTTPSPSTASPSTPSTTAKPATSTTTNTTVPNPTPPAAPKFQITNPVVKNTVSSVPNPNPDYGNNGVGSTAQKQAGQDLLKSGDAAAIQAEIERTQGIMANRESSGQSNAVQEDWLSKLQAAMPKQSGTVPSPYTSAPTFTAPDPSSAPQIPAYTPAIPVMDEAAIRKYAEEQVARKLSDARLAADQQISRNQLAADQQNATLKSNYDKMYETIGEDRALEDTSNARNLSPFSGRSDYAQGMVAQNRARTDRENQATLQSNQANVQALASQLGQQINEKYAALQNAAPEEREALFQSIKNDERNYDLMVHGQLTDDMLANSQLQNTAFNQALQGYNANRSAYEFDKNYGLNEAALTGQYNGQSTLAGKQANLDAALAVSNLTGKVVAPSNNWGQLYDRAGSSTTPTYQAQQDSIRNNQNQQQIDNQASQFAQSLGLDYKKLSQDQQQFLKQIAISQQNANTSAASQRNSAANANFDKLMDVFKATGTAPDGLQSYGIQPGDGYSQYSNSSPTQTQQNNAYTSELIQNLDAITTPDIRKKALTENKAEIIRNIGQSGYDRLYKSYFPE